jgi:hypothetical protein
MNSPGKLPIVISLIFILACVSSCKKKSSSSPLSNILIATVDVNTSGSIEHYRFVYNSGNDVDSMIIVGGGLDTGSNDYKYFTYYNTSYTITDQHNNSYTVEDSNGVIEEIVSTVTADSIILTYYSGLLGIFTNKSPGTFPPYYVESIASYSWSGGDVNSVSIQGGALETYNYNTSQSGQIGDGARIDYFLNYGKPFFKTNHLPVELLSNGVWAEEYFYQYDNIGRISQLVKVGNNNSIGANDTTTYSYTYYY